jgi:hypothetical protein
MGQGPSYSTFVLVTGHVCCPMGAGNCSSRHLPTRMSARSEVLTAAFMTVAIFWDIAPRSPYVSRRFGGTYLLHIQGRKVVDQKPAWSR